MKEDITVEPVIGGHPKGMTKWTLNAGLPPNTGCKKYSLNTIKMSFYINVNH